MIDRLLDTHALLWALAGDPRLPASIGEALDADPTCFGVSDASFWEIAVKRSAGKLVVPADLPQVVDLLGLARVAITREQAWAVHDLDLHHRDPFGRLLVAQARDLGVAVVTADAAFAAYDVTVDWPTG